MLNLIIIVILCVSLNVACHTVANMLTIWLLSSEKFMMEYFKRSAKISAKLSPIIIEAFEETES